MEAPKCFYPFEHFIYFLFFSWYFLRISHVEMTIYLSTVKDNFQIFLHTIFPIIPNQLWFFIDFNAGVWGKTWSVTESNTMSSETTDWFHQEDRKKKLPSNRSMWRRNCPTGETWKTPHIKNLSCPKGTCFDITNVFCFFTWDFSVRVEKISDLQKKKKKKCI